MKQYKVYDIDDVVLETPDFMEAESAYNRLESNNKQLYSDGVEIASFKTVKPPRYVSVYFAFYSIKQIEINGFSDRNRLLSASKYGNEKVYDTLKDISDEVPVREYIQSVKLDMYNDPFNGSYVEIWSE